MIIKFTNDDLNLIAGGKGGEGQAPVSPERKIEIDNEIDKLDFNVALAMSDRKGPCIDPVVMKQTKARIKKLMNEAGYLGADEKLIDPRDWLKNFRDRYGV